MTSPSDQPLPEDRLLALETTEVSPVIPPQPARSSLLQKQMPGLDILRGIAVLAVVCYHGLFWYIPNNVGTDPATGQLGKVFAGGWLGVNLFFVLSGFLITGILYDTRHRKNYWSSFYVRRVLRILPLYLVTLVLATYLFHLTPFYLFLCLFYAANFINYLPSPTHFYGPLWSLAVEEQFYLVWPFLVRRLSLRVLAFICISLIAGSPVLRALAVHHIWLGDPYSTTWLLADNLAWGSLIALLLRTRHATQSRIQNFTLALVASSAVLLLALSALHLLSRKSPAGAALQTVPFLLLFAALLLLALRFGANPTLLRWTAPIRFFGYISYGLYLLHIAFFSIYDTINYTLFHTRFLFLTPFTMLLRFTVVVGLGSLLCFLSRRYFEERFLRLKEKLVPYNSK